MNVHNRAIKRDGIARSLGFVRRQFPSLDGAIRKLGEAGVQAMKFAASGWSRSGSGGSPSNCRPCRPKKPRAKTGEPAMTRPLHRLARSFVLGTAIVTLSAAAATAQTAPSADVLIRGGSIYDGSGGDPYVGDVLIKGDRIVAVTHGARSE